MSHRASAWAIRQLPKTAHQKAVLMVLADFHNEETDKCYPSAFTISILTICNERTVRRVLEELQDQGFLFIEPRDGKTPFVGFNWEISTPGTVSGVLKQVRAEHRKQGLSEGRKLTPDTGPGVGKTVNIDGLSRTLAADPGQRARGNATDPGHSARGNPGLSRHTPDTVPGVTPDSDDIPRTLTTLTPDTGPGVTPIPRTLTTLTPGPVSDEPVINHNKEINKGRSKSKNKKHSVEGRNEFSAGRVYKLEKSWQPDRSLGLLELEIHDDFILTALKKFFEYWLAPRRKKYAQTHELWNERFQKHLEKNWAYHKKKNGIKPATHEKLGFETNGQLRRALNEAADRKTAEAWLKTMTGSHTPDQFPPIPIHFQKFINSETLEMFA